MKRILALLLVALLLVSILPVTVAATQLDLTPDTTTTPGTYEENLTPPESLLNLLLGDAEAFIENERIIFAGEAGDLNTRLLLVACVVVLLIPAGVFFWGAAKLLKVILEFVLGYMDLMLNLLFGVITVAILLLERFGSALARAGKLIWEILNGARRKLDDWIKRTEFTDKQLKVNELFFTVCMIVFMLTSAWDVYNYAYPEACCGVVMAMIAMYIAVKFHDRKKNAENSDNVELE